MLRPAAGGCPGGAGAASSPRRPSSGVPANACLFGGRRWGKSGQAGGAMHDPRDGARDRCRREAARPDQWM